MMNTKHLFFVVSFFLGGIFVSHAQIDTRLGGMLAYGTELDQLGIGVNAEFGVAENFTIAPSLIYYLPKSTGSGDYKYTLTWWELNADAHYYFVDEGEFTAYGLGGLNYTSAKGKYKGNPEFSMYESSYSAGKIGLNLGIGANMQLDGALTPFAEIKYVVGDFDHLVIGAGVRFDL